MDKKQENNEEKQSQQAPESSESEIPTEDKAEAEAANIWKDAAKPDEEKAREDEFEEYLEELFM